MPRILIPRPNSASPPLSSHVLMRAYSLRDYLQWNTHYNGYITVGRVSGNPPDRGQRWANNTGEPLPLRSEATEEGTGPALTEDRMIQDSLTVLSPSDAIRGAWRTSPASLSSYDPESCRGLLSAEHSWQQETRGSADVVRKSGPLEAEQGGVQRADRRCPAPTLLAWASTWHRV